MELRKRLEEVRLLESRKSARLMDQDTDFARLADMAGDRKRASSNSIDVPTVHGSVQDKPVCTTVTVFIKETFYSGYAHTEGAFCLEALL